MPKYVEYESENDSGGDDEIVVIPFVKPPPPLIDLIEEDEEERSNTKKKSKKRKKSKDGKKEAAIIEAAAVSEENLETDNVRRVIERVGRNIEPSVVVTNENIIATSNNLGSSNVASLSKSPGGNAEDSPPQMDIIQDTLPCISVSNSIFEPGANLDTEDISSTTTTVTPPDVGSSSTRAPPRSRRGGRTAAELKRPRRISQTSATKKTAEEISSFLNTLGIPIEVRDLNPPIPRKPRVPKRKSTETAGQSKETASNATIPSSTTQTPNTSASLPTTSNESMNITPLPLLDGYVQVTEENTKKKGTRKKKISDESTPVVQKEKAQSTNTVIDVGPTDLMSNFFLPGDGVLPGRWDPNVEVPGFSGIINTAAESNDGDTSKKRKRAEKESGDNVSKKSGGNLLASPSPKRSKQKESDKEPGRRKRRRSENINDSEVENNVPGVHYNEEIPTDQNRSLRGDSDIEGVGQKKAKDRSSSKDKEKGRHGRSPTKKRSKNLPPDTESSNINGKEEEIPNVALNDRIQENEKIQSSEKEKSKNSSKEKEKIKSPQKDKDKIRMPPPAPPTDVSNTKRSNTGYFLNHPGFPSVMPPNMKEFYGTFRGRNYDYREINRLQSNNPRLWKTPEDFSQRKKPRFGARCKNCCQWDHTTNKCPEKYKPPCCSCCGRTGHTVNGTGRYSCPESCCLNCGSKNKDYSSGCRKCTYMRHPPRCSLCGIQGHLDDSCPDHWRRYHSITHPIPEGEERFILNVSVQPTEYKRRNDSFCSNCGGKGHNYYHCTKEKYKKNPYHRHKPYVLSELDLSNIQLPAAADGGAIHRHSTSTITTTTHAAVIPICDRTVTVDSNRKNDSKEDDGETIRVQILNDSPTKKDRDYPEKLNIPPKQSDDVATIRCMENNECTNRITNFHKCHSIAVSTFQQTLLKDANKTDGIQNIEKKTNVEISILSSLKVHIAGEKWRQAESELYDLLFSRAKPQFNAPNPSETVQEAEIESGQSQYHRKVTEDGINISVALNKPSEPPRVLFNPHAAAFTPHEPPTSSLDVDERFVSAQDLVTTIPIIRPDGPFAPGQYVPYSILPPLTTIVPPQAIPIISPPIQILQNPLFNSVDKEVNVNTSNLINKTTPKRSSSKKTPPPSVQTDKVSEKTKRPVDKDEHVVVVVDSDDDDIIFLEEKTDKNRSATSENDKEKPVKCFNSRDGLNVFLLPSEWDIVFAESLKKEGILSKISRLFEVSIFVCKDTNTCTIHNGSAFDRERAKDKVTLWLGCNAAKKTFVLEMPNEAPSNDTERLSPEKNSGTVKAAAAGSKPFRIKCNMRPVPSHLLNPSPNIPGRGQSRQSKRGSPKRKGSDRGGRAPRGSTNSRNTSLPRFTRYFNVNRP